jgi:molybdate transport system substrate-binding protein
MTNQHVKTALLAVFTLHAAQVADAQDTAIHILCSNGFRAAMEKLLPQAEHAAGRPVKLEFGASANFKRSIEGGGQFDLAIVTPQIVEDLTIEGKIAAGTKVDLASTGIGIAVRAGHPKPDVSSAQAVKRMLLGAKSIGYVKVGAGTPAIVDMLNRLGVAAEVQSKTIFQSGAEESMANVAGGKVEVAFALVSEILPVPGVQLAGPVPPEFQKQITMSAGIAASTKNRKALDEIIKSMTGTAAATSIKAAGLDPIAKQ